MDTRNYSGVSRNSHRYPTGHTRNNAYRNSSNDEINKASVESRLSGFGKTTASIGELSIKQIEDKANIELNKMDDLIELNRRKIESFEDMQQYMAAISTATADLRHPMAVSSRAVTGSTNEIQGTWDQYVIVEPQNGAALINYNLNIQQIALAQVQAIGASTIGSTQVGFNSNLAAVVATNATAGQLQAGSFQLNNVTVTLNNNDTLQNIMQNINNVQNQTNVQAQIFQYGNNDFRLKLIANLTGIVNMINIDDSVNNVFANVNTQQLVAAQDAMITIDGITIPPSPSNIINNVGNNITMNLLMANTDNSKYIKFQVAANTEVLKTDIAQLVEEYNEFKRFVARQTQKEDHEYVETAYLAREEIFKTAVIEINSSFMNPVNGLTSTIINSIQSLGYTARNIELANPETETPKILDIVKIDPTKAAQADVIFTTSPNQVGQLFEFQFNAAQNRLFPRDRKAILAVNDFVVNINTNGFPNILDTTYNVVFNPTESVAIISQQNNKQVVEYADFISAPYSTAANSAGIITGRSGTAIQGFSMEYMGSNVSANDAIAVNITQGIADRVQAVISKYLGSNGLIAKTIQNTEEKIKVSNQKIPQLERARDQEIKSKMARIGASGVKLEKIEQTKGFLKAMRNATKN